MKLSQPCQAFVQGFPVYVTILCSSHLQWDLQKLEALCLVLYPLLSYMHWGVVERCVFPEWNLSHRKLSWVGRFFSFYEVTHTDMLGEKGTQMRMSKFAFSPPISHSFLGYRWERQLVFRSKLTMHTAFDRKDNAHPAEITALGISKWVARKQLLKTFFYNVVSGKWYKPAIVLCIMLFCGPSVWGSLVQGLSLKKS